MGSVSWSNRSGSDEEKTTVAPGMDSWSASDRIDDESGGMR
jgi:hypothetical protein